MQRQLHLCAERSMLSAVCCCLLACVSLRCANAYMRLVLQHLGPDQQLMQYLSTATSLAALHDHANAGMHMATHSLHALRLSCYQTAADRLVILETRPGLCCCCCCYCCTWVSCLLHGCVIRQPQRIQQCLRFISFNCITLSRSVIGSSSRTHFSVSTSAILTRPDSPKTRYTKEPGVFMSLTSGSTIAGQYTLWCAPSSTPL